MDTLHYKGWAIIPTALPTGHHHWAASCDLARITGDGQEVFEDVTEPVESTTREAALSAACAQAKAQIDNIIANPQ
jgi:hypothetical protein